jgi:hypothetical protein
VLNFRTQIAKATFKLYGEFVDDRSARFARQHSVGMFVMGASRPTDRLVPRFNSAFNS